MSFDDSDLYKDLTRDSRDAMYRAMTYIKRCKGPSIVGHSDDLESLRANRELMLEWLLKQQDREMIVERYSEYRRRWSPIFID